MTSSLGFTLFNLGIAVVLSILIYRAQKEKRLEITMISGPVTKVEKIVLTGRGITIASVGWGISAILFSFSGLGSLDTSANMGTYFFMTFMSGTLAIITMLVASYVTPHSKD